MDQEKTGKMEIAPWNYRQIAVCMILTLVLQGIILPCLSPECSRKGFFALSIDIYVITRTLIAYLRNERNRRWVFYIGLTYSSPLWIEVLFYIAGRI